MIIGVPKEVKDHESRVGVTPAGVKALVEAGHKVLVEQKAGALSAMPDDEHQAAGAEMVGSAHDAWRLAEMVVKVKEPVEKEYGFFREGLVLFTYLHLAPLPVLTDKLLASKVTGIAYETIRASGRKLPGEGKGRPRRVTWRGARRAASDRLHFGRGHCGHERRQDRAGHGRKCHYRRLEPQPAARTRRYLQRPRLHPGLELL